MDGDVIPVLDVGFGSLDEFYLLFGIVDEGAELASLLVADIAGKEFGDFTLDVARGILQYMEEGFALAVQVGQKVFGSLGQIHDGFEIDYLGSGSCYCRERVGQQLEVLHVEL